VQTAALTANRGKTLITGKPKRPIAEVRSKALTARKERAAVKPLIAVPTANRGKTLITGKPKRPMAHSNALTARKERAAVKPLIAVPTANRGKTLITGKPKRPIAKARSKALTARKQRIAVKQLIAVLTANRGKTLITGKPKRPIAEVRSKALTARKQRAAVKPLIAVPTANRGKTLITGKPKRPIAEARGKALTARKEPTAKHPLAHALDRAADFARADKAENTRKAYRSDFARFQSFCAQHRLSPLPAAPQTLAAFIATEAENAKASTIERRLAAIRYAHKLAGLKTPTDDERVKATARGIRRTLGTATSKKTPITDDTLRAILATLTTNGQKNVPATKALIVTDRCAAPALSKGAIADLRDRALLLLGFAGAFRRSELVALNVADLLETKEGLRVSIHRSKTKPEATTIAIARGRKTCPVSALKAWLAAATITKGALFRRVTKAGRVLPDRLTAQSVALIVKAHARRAGLDPEQFSAHSLRAGFLTSAARRGASLFKMMDVSRHRSLSTLKGYIRDGELFADHAGEGLL
jgi:site-specific recombinase XerD